MIRFIGAALNWIRATLDHAQGARHNAIAHDYLDVETANGGSAWTASTATLGQRCS